MKLKEKQILYRFSHTTFKEEEVPVIEKQEDGTEKKILQTKKTPEVTEYVFKIPNRMEMEDLEMFYSIKVNEFVKKGLMTKDMIMKQYLDNGGELTDKEQKQFFEKSKDLFDIQNEYYLLASQEDKTEIEEKREKNLLEKIYILKRELSAFDEIKNNIFEHTADKKARNKTLLYCVLFFCYKKEENEEEYSNVFSGKDFENRESKFYEMEESSQESEDDFFGELFEKMSLVSLFYFMHNITTKEEMTEAMESVANQKIKDTEYEESLSEDDG